MRPYSVIPILPIAIALTACGTAPAEKTAAPAEKTRVRTNCVSSRIDGRQVSFDANGVIQFGDINYKGPDCHYLDVVDAVLTKAGDVLMFSAAYLLPHCQLDHAQLWAELFLPTQKFGEQHLIDLPTSANGRPGPGASGDGHPLFVEVRGLSGVTEAMVS